MLKAPRNFNCPETNEPCTDPLCSKAKGYCCERESLETEGRRLATARENAIEHSKIWEVLGPYIEKWKGNSN